MDIVQKFCEFLYHQSSQIDDIYVQSAYMDAANYIAGCDISDALKRLEVLQSAVTQIRQQFERLHG